MTGQELKESRIRWGLTQSELGEKLGVSASAIAHLESEKHKITRQTEKLLEILIREYI